MMEFDFGVGLPGVCEAMIAVGVEALSRQHYQHPSKGAARAEREEKERKKEVVYIYYLLGCYGKDRL